MIEMRYLIATIDLDQELPSLPLQGYSGLALIVRRRGRLIEFILEEGGRSAISAAELSELVLKNASEAILADQIRHERGNSLPKRMPSVTVAICTRNRPEWVDRCLSALELLDP